MSFEGSDSHLDQSGLITFTGEIELGNAIDFDESLDDRINPSRFCRGVPVILEIADLSGTLRRHPRGALRILKAQFIEETRRQKLQVGDLISLLNFKEPLDTEKADNKGCEGKTAGEIILNLLAEAGINSIGGALPSTIYNYPLNLSGSYLANVGKILYANGLFGWIDKNEVFQIRSDEIRWNGTQIALIVGSSEIWYKRLEGAEMIVEKVKATGTEKIVRDAAPYTIDFIERYGPASTVDKNYSSNLEIVIEQITTIREWDEAKHKLTVTTTSRKPYGLVIPEIFFGVNQAKLTEIISEIQIEESYFENNNECKLKNKVTKIYQPRGTYLEEYKTANTNYVFNIVEPVLIKEIREDYSYDEKERMTRINSRTQELEITILNGTDEDWTAWELPPENLTPSESLTQEWQELAKDYWEYKASKLACLVRVKPDAVKFLTGSKVFSNKTDLITDPSGSEIRRSNSGQQQPPATERCPDKCNYEENNIEEEAIFGDGCSFQYRERLRTFNIDFLAGRKEPALRPGEVIIYPTTGGRSQAANQLLYLARNEGRKLQARYKGQAIAMPLGNEIFDYHPLFNISATEITGTTQNFLSDGANWVVAENECLWSCDGLWVGTSINGINVPPYTEPQNLYLGFGQGIEFRLYPYELTTETKIFELGLGQGIEFTGGFLIELGKGQGLNFEGEIIDLYWEDLDEELWNLLDENLWNSLGSRY
jgi:hypothetical protein